MEKIKQFFAREPINTGRQKDIDLLKAFAILFMVVCHSVMFLTDDVDSLGYVFAADILGGLLGAAPFFMMSLGIGIIYSRRNDPKSLFKRGSIMFLLSYVFNFFRAGISLLILEPWRFFETILQGDILQFAGLTFMAIALFKKLKAKSYVVLVIAVVLSCTSFLFYGLPSGNPILDCFINLIVPTNEYYIGFTFFSWFIFVVIGMLLGNIIQRVKNLDKFYLRTMIVSIICAIPLLGLDYTYAEPEIGFYGIVFPFALGFIFNSLFLLSICHFLVKILPEKFLKVSQTTSTNITVIYVIHWLFVGNFSIILDAEIPLLVLYIGGISLFVISYFLSILYRNVKNKIKNKTIGQNS